jgi:hypothetical protein
VGAADVQDPVEALAPQASHPAFGVRLRLWRPHQRPDHADALRTENVVEAARELAIAVADKEMRRLLPVGELRHKFARLLRDPSFIRIGP